MHASAQPGGFTDREGDILTLIYKGGWSQSEVAREFGLSEATVSRTLKELLERLKDEDGVVDPTGIPWTDADARLRKPVEQPALAPDEPEAPQKARKIPKTVPAPKGNTKDGLPDCGDDLVKQMRKELDKVENSEVVADLKQTAWLAAVEGKCPLKAIRASKKARQRKAGRTQGKEVSMDTAILDGKVRRQLL